jgi:GntR family transcriptional regulator / MocR family aminotransferase
MGLRRGANEQRIVDEAASRSIRVYGGSQFYARPGAAPPSLVLGYGWIPEAAIRDGVRELSSVIGHH